MNDEESGPGAVREQAAAAASGYEQRLADALAEFADVRWADLFGSSVQRERFHDLDVGFMFDATVTAAVALGRIVREGRVIADRDPAARGEWEAEANGRALDLEPRLAEFERLRNEALRRQSRRGR